MTTAEKLAADLKQAMLARDSETVDLLNMLKTALQYEAIGSSDKQLSEDKVIAVLQRERKKRLEAAQLYMQNQQTEKAAKETDEAEVISRYLPEPLSADELKAIVEQAINETHAETIRDMGKVIGQVKLKSQGRADGSEVANMVKQLLGDG